MSARNGGAGTKLRLGTRGSALALAQSKAIADRLGAEVVVIESEGDRSRESLASLGGTGVFATALRDALRDGRVDVVVHSFKDLPTTAEDGLAIGAVPKRADARDALCARNGFTLATLPEGATVGTGSPRRRAQLAALRPDLVLRDIRGNVDTRLGRVGLAGEASVFAPSNGSEGSEAPVLDEERALDAVVLAAAGLGRLGRSNTVTEMLELGDWPTAPAQGALAIEVRRGDEKRVASLDHRATRLAAEAERGVLARLEAGCAAPIGAHAMIEDGLLFLTATVYRPDGGAQLSSSHALYPEDTRTPAADLAERVAVELLEQGAAELAPLGGAR